MRGYKQLLAMVGVCLLSVGISACSSPVVSETKKASSEVSQTPPAFVEASETPEAITVALEQGAELQGFDSPESAIAAYLVGLRDKDLNYMLATFGSEIYVDHYGLQKASELAQTEISPQEVETSAMVDFTRSISIENRNNEIRDDILRQYAILFQMNMEPYSDRKLQEDGNAKKLLEQISNQIRAVDLSSLKLLGFIPPEKLSERYSSEAHQKNMPGIAEGFGADKFESCLAVIELGHNQYLLFLDVLEYDGRWFNLHLGGVFANMMNIDAEMAGTLLFDEEDKQVIDQYDLLPEGCQSSSQQLMGAAGALKPAKQNVTTEAAAGFHSPQEAAKAYLEGLMANDLNGMMSTFAVESYVDHYDLQAEIEFINGYLFMMHELNLPVADDFSRELNIQSRKKKIVEEIVTQYSALCLINGDFFGNAPIEEKDLETEEDSFLKLAEMLNAMDFDSMKILGYIPYSALHDAKDLGKFQKNIDRQAAQCGADRMEGSIVAFELMGNKYYLCLDTIEYNGKWYNKRLGGNLASILSNPVDLGGNMIPPAEEEAELETLMIPFE